MSDSGDLIKAVIFDMDGLLIDSEPFWQETERKVFRNYGIELNEKMQSATFGLRTDEQVRYWYNFRPWENPDFEKVEKEYDNIIIDFFKEKGELFKGVAEILEFLKKQDYGLALASSSRMNLIDTFLDKFSLRSYFDVIHSAEYEKYGKPNPAVYLTTAEKLEIPAFSCLAFEDSLNGVIAAKAARMKVVAVPDPKHFNDAGYGIADLKIRSLQEFTIKDLKRFQKYD